MMQPLPNEETRAAKFEGQEPAPKEKGHRTSKKIKAGAETTSVIV
jgi:hypothetical protein